jgi:hypothetical protein
VDEAVLPARHVILEENALAARVLSHYGLPAPLRCRFFRRGMSDVYRVKCPAGSYFLKVYLRDMTQADAEAAAAFALALRERDVAVAVPLADETGQRVRALPTPEGPRYAVLNPALDGPAPVETDLAQSRAFGGWPLNFTAPPTTCRRPWPAVNWTSVTLSTNPWPLLRHIWPIARPPWPIWPRSAASSWPDWSISCRARRHSAACATAICTPATPATPAAA